MKEGSFRSAKKIITDKSKRRRKLYKDMQYESTAMNNRVQLILLKVEEGFTIARKLIIDQMLPTAIMSQTITHKRAGRMPTRQDVWTCIKLFR